MMISILLALLSSVSWATAKSPYVIFVHGGAWVSGSPEKYSKLAEALNKQGSCAVLAKYTLAPEAQHPVPVRELDETIRKTSRLSSPKCDAKRIYLIGHSAGAHMIAFWNTAFTNPAVKGLIGVEGIYDLPLLIKTWPSYEEHFISAEFGSERETASPTRVKAKSKTPWLLLQSKEDELVDSAQTKTFSKFLAEQKIPNQTIELSGSHFDVLVQLETPDSKIAKAVREFIAR